MSLPPETVPSGLSIKEYERLQILYSLMGRQEQMAECLKLLVEAKKLAARLNPAMSNEQSASPQQLATKAQEKLALELGQQMGLKFTKILTQRYDGDASPEKKQDWVVSQLLEGIDESSLRTAGVSHEQIEAMAKQLVTLIDSAKSQSEPPPKDVPLNLSAKEYYDLGVKYKTVGWTEQARDALNYAYDKDPNGDTGLKAQRYLRTKIPSHPVPMIAVQKNIAGYNQRFSGQLEAAKATFQNLNAEYPDFEWPYSNLGSLYLALGEPELALKALEKALAINPYYVNARLHLCRLQILTADFAGARKNLSEIQEIDPNEDISRLTANLEKLETWDEH